MGRRKVAKAGNGPKRKCRACKGGQEDERDPLCAPCGCDGAEKWIHTTCLATVARHCWMSWGEVCCHCKETYLPSYAGFVYASPTPEKTPPDDVIPVSRGVFGCIKLAYVIVFAISMGVNALLMSSNAALISCKTDLAILNATIGN